MNLTTHFTLEELCFSSTAARLEIPNDPPDDVKAHLQLLAEGLEKIRALLGDHPLHIDSGYRCPTLNRAVNGAADSAHLIGYAADILCRPFGSPAEIVQKIRNSYIRFDQCILEGAGEGAWTHISFDPRLRNEVLNAKFGPNGTTYRPLA